MTAAPKGFWDFVQVGRHEGACSIWSGPINKDGFGVYRRRLAHKLAWEEHHGKKVPKGHWVVQTCRIRLCCYWGHLELRKQTQEMAQKLARERRRRRQAALRCLRDMRAYVATQTGLDNRCAEDLKLGRLREWVTGLKGELRT